MNGRIARRRAAFWVASAVAALYWLVLSWRVERALWDLVAWLALSSTSFGSLVPTIDTTLVFVFIATAYAVPPLAFAACVRMMHVQVDRRAWAVPLTGFVLMFVFLGSESLALGGGPLDLLRISTFADASWATLIAALFGLGAGSTGAWALLASRHGVAGGASNEDIERTAPALD